MNVPETTRQADPPLPAVSVRQRRAGAAALIGLGCLAIILAAPGPALVPAAAVSPPGWLLGVFGRGFGLDGPTYLAVLVVSFGLYLTVVGTAQYIRRRILWAGIGVLVGLFVLAPPLLSQDVFSYIAYGRLAARHGLDPYVAVPADRPSDPVVRYVGWRSTPSTYGPAFTLATFPLGLVDVALALWSLKVVAGVAFLGLVALTAHIAAVRGGDPQRAAVIVGLNPIMLVHVVGGAHNDALMMMLLMASVALIGREREALGGAALVGAFAVKASAVFVAPFAVAGSARRLRLLVAMALASVAVAIAALAVFGGRIGAIATAIGHNQALSSEYSVPATVSRLTSVPLDVVRGTALAVYLVTLIGLLGWTVRGGDWVRSTGWAAIGLLAVTSWLMPWYLLWLLPFAAVGRDRWLLGATLAFCAFQLVNRVPL